MKKLTYTQEYFLCAVSSKGNIPAVTGGEASTCLVVSGITELLAGGYVGLNEKEKLIVCGEWQSDLPHLEPLYHKIATLKRPLAIADFVVGIYNPKQINELINAVGASLVAAGYADEIVTQARTKKLYRYVPKEKVVKKLIEKVRTGFTEEIKIDENLACLAALLESSGFLRDYLGKPERDGVRKRLKAIGKSTSLAPRAKEILDIYAACAIVIMGGGW